MLNKSILKIIIIVLSVFFTDINYSIASQGRLEASVAKLTDINNKVLFVSTGVPFPPGQIFKEKDFAVFDQQGKELRIAVRTLAKWGSDGSIRSLLVQFTYEVDKFFAPVGIQWGNLRLTDDLPLKEIEGELPEGYLVLSPTWLCDSLVIGEQVPMGNNPYSKLTERNYMFPKYDDNINNLAPLLKEKKGTVDVRNDGYYDKTHVLYQLYIRSGDIDFLIAARNEVIKYRDEIVSEGAERGRHKTYKQTRNIYVQAMVDDYLLIGDEKSLQIASYMAEYLKNDFPSERAFYPKTAHGFWTEREAAFPFLGIITYYELTGKKEYLIAADKIMENLYKTQQQWLGRGGFIHNLYSHDPEEGARKDEYGGSPFMTGLLLEAIVKYHQITQSEVAKESIFLALDWLSKECLAPDGNSFVYTTAAANKNEGHPDLNLLIAHAFGYGYKISGYKKKDYLELGKRIFSYGIDNAYLGDWKHVNQNYRSSGHFLAYIKGQ